MYASKLLVIFLITTAFFAKSNRVCNSMVSYYLPFSKNCWEDPSDRLNATEIVRDLWGLNVEEHYVKTEDGYVLYILRCYLNITKNNPVVFGHGALHNNMAYIVKHDESTAYYLAMQGYDIWLPNFRGARGSRRHSKYKMDQKEYWNFSYHEIGYYDLPVILEHVYRVTNQKAFYIGLSVGATVAMVYTSTKPAEAEKYLAGCVSMGLAAQYVNKNTTIGYGEFVSNILEYAPPQIVYSDAIHLETPLMRTVLTQMARQPLLLSTFIYIFDLIVGWDLANKDWSVYPVLLTTAVEAISKKMLLHLVQNAKTDKFKYLDYGREQNLKLYGQKTAPQYPVERISVPLVFISGLGDICTPYEGMKLLYEKLPQKTRCGFHIVDDHSWTHSGYVLARNLEEYISKPILNYLEKMENSKC